MTEIILLVLILAPTYLVMIDTAKHYVHNNSFKEAKFGVYTTPPDRRVSDRKVILEEGGELTEVKGLFIVVVALVLWWHHD